jgi:hypothetical protein
MRATQILPRRGKAFSNRAVHAHRPASFFFWPGRNHEAADWPAQGRRRPARRLSGPNPLGHRNSTRPLQWQARRSLPTRISLASQQRPRPPLGQFACRFRQRRGKLNGARRSTTAPAVPPNGVPVEEPATTTVEGVRGSVRPPSPAAALARSASGRRPRVWVSAGFTSVKVN